MGSARIREIGKDEYLLAEKDQDRLVVQEVRHGVVVALYDPKNLTKRGLAHLSNDPDNETLDHASLRAVYTLDSFLDEAIWEESVQAAVVSATMYERDEEKYINRLFNRTLHYLQKEKGIGEGTQESYAKRKSDGELIYCKTIVFTQARHQGEKLIDPPHVLVIPRIKGSTFNPKDAIEISLEQ